jgi:hypothetical protein
MPSLSQKADAASFARCAFHGTDFISPVNIGQGLSWVKALQPGKVKPLSPGRGEGMREFQIKEYAAGDRTSHRPYEAP